MKRIKDKLDKYNDAQEENLITQTLESNDEMLPKTKSWCKNKNRKFCTWDVKVREIVEWSDGLLKDRERFKILLLAT